MGQDRFCDHAFISIEKETVVNRTDAIIDIFADMTARKINLIFVIFSSSIF